ncbi:MAG: GNAT family N-acetyltransferase [Elainellaceae cyanobacterium]
MNDVRLSYSCQSGTTASRTLLLQYLKALHRESQHQESYPDQRPQQRSKHLAHFVDQYLGDDHRVWWAREPTQSQPIGCLWLGYTVDPIDGDRHPYIFLLYVLPSYRRHGIGRALITQAEAWAKERGYRKLSLHVFCQNEAGQHFYQQLSYHPQSTLMEKTL